MRIMKRAFVSGFACAVAAGAMASFAQDALDSLLSHLESDGKKKSAPVVATPAEETAPKPAAEEVKPVEAVPALEEVKPAEAPKAAYDYDSDDVAAQISQNLEALVGTTEDTAPKAPPKHPTANESTTSKFASLNLQFGRNYDPKSK